MSLGDRFSSSYHRAARSRSCGISNPAFWSACEVPKNAFVMILNSLDPAPSGAHPRGRTWPATLTICFGFLGAIWLGQLQNRLPAANICSKFVLIYLWLSSEPLCTPASPDKIFPAESARPESLGAICLGQPPPGPPAPDFRTKFVWNYSVLVYKLTGAPASPDKNLLVESARPEFLGAICLGQPQSGPPAPDFRTKFVWNYSVLVYKLSGASESPDKIFLAESARPSSLHAIWPGYPPTSLPVAPSMLTSEETQFFRPK